MNNTNIEMLDTQDLYKLLDLYFTQKKDILYEHHHNSFKQYINEYIPEICEKDNNIFYSKIIGNYQYNHYFKYENIRIKPPVMEYEDNKIMTPSDARKFNTTYACEGIGDITQFLDKIDIVTGQKTTKQIGETEINHVIFKIPLMVNKEKGECKYDPGGYFIINGNEKVVISLEKMAENKPVIFLKKEQNEKIYSIQVTSKNFETEEIQLLKIRFKKDNLLILDIPQFNPVSIFVLIKALGIESNKDIIDYIINNDIDENMKNLLRTLLYNTVDDNKKRILTKDHAMQYLLSKLKKYNYYNINEEKKDEQKILLNKILDNLLPHITIKENKIYFILYMIRRLLNCYLGRIPIDDKDSYLFKRVETSGVLLSSLFLQGKKKQLNDCTKDFKKRNLDDDNPIPMINQIKPSAIEMIMKNSLATGFWGGNKNKKGVAQVLHTYTFQQKITILRRVDNPSVDATTNKLTAPRHLHNSQIGYICPAETPDGPQVGLVKSLALSATITLLKKSQIKIIKDFLEEKIQNLNNSHPYIFNELYKLFLNGEWLGLLKDKYKPYDLVEELKNMRKNKKLDRSVSIVFDIQNKEIRLECSAGRLIRPMLVVKNNKLNINKKIMEEILNNKIKSWEQLMDEYPDVIEYVDVDESHYNLYALNESYLEQKLSNNDNNNINRYNDTILKHYTHCEIHPILLTGTITSSIPFVNHNHGPRNIYHYNISKQAMGLYNSNYINRLDKSYVLYNSQKALVSTITSKYLDTDKLTAGENIIVAVCAYTGYNQEDSIIVNQSSIDRGLFSAISLTKETQIISKNPSTSQDDIFTKPDKNKVMGIKSGSYDKLNDDGYVPEETKINNEDIIIGKIKPIQQVGNSSKMYKDDSVLYKDKIEGIVDKVWHDIYDNNGYKMYKVRIRQKRILKIGDKMASRHGQKGTVGLSLRQEDMPFTKDGVVPDIIINPNCIPSRMTIGQIIECVAGKVSAIKGCEYDGTGFNDINIDDIKKQLEENNFDGDGKEYLYNGMTGKKIKAKIFIGPTYYLRLKHLVDDKMHSRGRGPIQKLTRQPLEGKANNGGGRFGEMERDSIAAHGMSQFLKERMMESSDIYTTYICDECGLIAQKMLNSNNLYYCKKCNNSINISKIQIPYAFKLLVQELMSINILPRIRTK